jgi:hypothetical protein
VLTSLALLVQREGGVPLGYYRFRFHALIIFCVDYHSIKPCHQSIPDVPQRRILGCEAVAVGFSRKRTPHWPIVVVGHAAHVVYGKQRVTSVIFTLPFGSFCPRSREFAFKLFDPGYSFVDSSTCLVNRHIRRIALLAHSQFLRYGFDRSLQQIQLG